MRFSGAAERVGSIPAGFSARYRRRRLQLATEAMQAAKRHGAIVSYDLNYRAVALEVDRREEARAGSESQAGADGGRHARQRRGFFGRAWV